MNGKRKWHKANGPAFLPGEQWYSAQHGQTDVGSCTILSVRQFGLGKWDYEVTYVYHDGRISHKDVWNFQVRYYHCADEVIK